MFLPLTPVRFIQRAADIFASDVAIIEPGVVFTWATFYERSCQLAAALLDISKPGRNVVAFLSDNNSRLLEGYFGVLMAGAILFPLQVRSTEERLSKALAKAAVDVLVADLTYKALAQRIVDGCGRKIQVIFFTQAGRGVNEYDALLDSYKPYECNLLQIDENSTAAIFTTSGSSSEPKLAMFSHRSLYLHALNTGATVEDEQDSVDLCAISLSHANGWGRPHIMAMRGIPQVLLPRFDAQDVLNAVIAHRVTMLSLVPTMAHALISLDSKSDMSYPSVRKILLGGSHSEPSTLARLHLLFPNAFCFSGYGLTEAAPYVCNSRLKRGDPVGAHHYTERTAAGWPIAGTRVRIIGENGLISQDNLQASGEIEVQSDSITDGYLGIPECFDTYKPDGWFPTGDVGRWVANRKIIVVDRIKDFINKGGEKIAPSTIETKITSITGVVECAVIPLLDHYWGEVPVVIIYAPSNPRIVEQAIQQELATLPTFLRPSKLIFQGSPLPKTATGKIDRRSVAKHHNETCS